MLLGLNMDEWKRALLTEELASSFDVPIKKHSQSSSYAPSEFLEPELRRRINWDAVIYDPPPDPEKFLASLMPRLEKEYRCYFERDTFVKDLKPGFWWKYVYAGCNAQIEIFLSKCGLGEAAEKLHSWPETIHPRELSEPLRRYLIGIGYLYPADEQTLAIHPNFLFAQLGMETTYSTADSPFLTRDLIRCPYHAVGGNFVHDLSDMELWGYWKDLVALSMGRPSEYEFYRPEHFRGTEPLGKELQNDLELGRKFVPARYRELEPRLEQFAWVFPQPEPK